MGTKPRQLPVSTATLEACDQEPIHTPNVIQAHGAVLVADAESRRITHASANLRQFLGRSPGWAIGRQLEDVLGKITLPIFDADSVEGIGSIGEIVALPGRDGGMLNVQAHRTGSRIFIDLQRTLTDLEAAPMPAVHSVLETFMHATTRAQLCELAVRGLRTVSGFDRVMAYRFEPNGDGEIIAEAKIDALESFRGMTYPAADIPPQARTLFLRNRVSAIADFDYRPVPVLADPAIDDGAPLDMTRSALRGISPIHCQYMRNMNVAASLTISLVHQGKLWGMLVCHNQSPRVVGPELRSVAKLLGQVTSLLIGSLSETEDYLDRLARRGALQAIVEAIGDGRPLGDSLTKDGAALLKLVDAGGAIVRVSGRIRRIGNLPPPAAQTAALAILEPLANGSTLAVEDLARRYPELAAATQAGSGALIMTFGLDNSDAIVWFRPERQRNIRWGGDPANHHSVDAVTGRLMPRRSFEVWNETTSGFSAPWTEADLALVEDLRVAVEAEVAAQASAVLARLRHFDPLTGLSNRRRLEEKLIAAREAGFGSLEVGLLFLDLDRFKAINDSLGHTAGDQLLVQTAERLLATCGPRHLVARLGGDEFVVLSSGLDCQGACELAENIRRALKLPFNLNGHSGHVSASIGVAMANEVGTIDILQAADMAMYDAKQRGGDRIATFQQSLHDHAVQKFELDHDLREAVHNTGQFMLVYQPLFDVGETEFTVVGFEALLRWRHPRLGWVAPDIFIPIAEKSGIIIPLGDWILTTAIRQAKAMRAATAERDLMMTINVSVMQLAEPNFCERVVMILHQAGLGADAICLEVTESMVSDNAIATVLHRIRSHGIKIAIDDFGTGYSSLSYLRRLPADIVKLDCSFLDEGDANTRDTRFVGAVVALIHAAGMAVIQEGVETTTHCRTTQASGADMVQGFMFGRPLLAPDAMKLVLARRVVPVPTKIIAEVANPAPAAVSATPLLH